MKKNIHEAVRESLDNIEDQIQAMQEADDREEQMLKSELASLRRKKELQPEQDEYDILCCQQESKRKLKNNASIYMVCALCLSISSLLMSVAGISGAKDLLNFREIFLGPNKFFALTMFALQTSMMLFSIMAYEFKTHHYKTYTKVRTVQVIVIGVSVACNYLYLVRTMTDSYKIFALLLAISTDLGSITMNELACVAKYRLYSTNAVENSNCTTFVEKMRIALFGRFIAKINIKYNQMTDLIKQSETSKELSILGIKEKKKKDDFELDKGNVDDRIDDGYDAYDQINENVC